MTKMKSLIATTFVAVGLAAAPIAANAQSSAGSQSSTRLSPGVPAQQGTYGRSGQTVGTVTAPSVGTSNQPSVGVTNSTPTWNNTNPPARK